MSDGVVKREDPAQYNEGYNAGYLAGLSDAREMCLQEQFQRPTNRFKDKPRAAYQSAALRCAWVILERLKSLGAT